MLLDKNKLQSYVPLSLKQNQLQPFFNSVRDRKVKKGFETDLARVETTKAQSTMLKLISICIPRHILSPNIFVVWRRRKPTLSVRCQQIHF